MRCMQMSGPYKDQVTHSSKEGSGGGRVVASKIPGELVESGRGRCMDFAACLGLERGRVETS